jgi:uncharacterized protein YkwD
MGLRIVHTALTVSLALGICAARAQIERPPAANAAGPKLADLGEVAQLIVRQTNALRTTHGAPPTAVSASLSRTAGYFADYMARTDQHGHDADGATPSARAKQHGYNFCMVSENIAMQYSSAGFATEELTQRLVAGWESSPGHRKNMLDPHAMETGTAVARSARTGRYYAVQMFGRPQSAAYAFQITNDSGARVQYRFGEREFDLPARTTRTHEQCRPLQLVMHGVADGAESTVQPTNGERFAVVRDSRGLRLVKE